MARSPRSLSGKVIAITGGGRGIGAATAALLARHGAQVVIGDLDLDTAKETADGIGSGTFAAQLDVTDRAGFTAFLDDVEERFGQLDVLINNAGIMPIGRIENETERTTSHQLEINLHAVIHGTREAVKRMKPRGSGHIVNIASAAGKIPLAGAATYTATKYGVVGFTESIRAEMKDSGVEVTYVCPGIVATELSAGVSSARGVKDVTPEDVAAGILGALQKPRADVFVPRSISPSIRFGQLLPRRLGEALARAMKGDRNVLDAIDAPERKEYEARAAASAPEADRELDHS